MKPPKNIIIILKHVLLVSLAIYCEEELPRKFLEISKYYENDTRSTFFHTLFFIFTTAFAFMVRNTTVKPYDGILIPSITFSSLPQLKTKQKTEKKKEKNVRPSRFEQRVWGQSSSCFSLHICSMTESLNKLLTYKPLLASLSAGKPRPRPKSEEESLSDRR